MTTENKNEHKQASLLEIYEYLGVSKVTKNQITIDQSQMRVDNAKIYLALLVALPFLIAVLSYNTQSLTSFSGTILLGFIIFIYSKNKYKIWHKTICFDKLKGTITFHRNFPYKNLVLHYKEVSILQKTHCVKGNCSEYYYLAENKAAAKNKPLPLFTGYTFACDSEKELFINLLKQFMEQKTLSEDLTLYNNTRK